MEFTNNSPAGLSVEVHNQTDRVTLVPRWSAAVGPGATVEYRPRAGDTRLERWPAHPELRDKLNVVSVDFFPYSDLVPTAIRLDRLPV